VTFRPSYDQLVFSGGGIRCFWHGGFLGKVGRYEDIRPVRVSGVSGGALSAAAWIGGREDVLLDLMTEAFRINDSNLSFSQDNFTPHQEIYRAVVETTLDREAVERVADGPLLQVTLSVPPQALPSKVSAVVYGLLYQTDQAVRSTPHLVLPQMAGLGALCVNAREMARQGRLADLICAAATIPPVFDVPSWNGRRVLDGGMTDKAPRCQPDEGRTLILLTKRYRNLPQSGRVTYVQPSREVAADKIDFSDPGKVTATWRQGERDGEAWMKTIGQSEAPASSKAA
jgi:predicted acylesterase/phospholipase RssA